MKFTAKPNYWISLSKLVMFNGRGIFHTDDEVLIKELKEKKHIVCEDTKKETTKKETKEETKEEVEEVKAIDISVLRKQYKDKFGKKAFGGRDEKTLIEKMA